MRSRPETFSASGLRLLGRPSAIGNEILELNPHHAFKRDEVFRFTSSASVDLLKQALDENLTLREKVQTLEDQMSSLIARLGLDQPPPRRITKSEAKREVAAYFQAHQDETIFPSDIADELNIDYDVVVDAIRQLERAGTIAKNP